MKRKELLIVIGCVLISLITVSCKNEQENTSKGNLKTMEVGISSQKLSRKYSAIVNGRQSVEIRPQVSGVITEVCIKEGSTVKKDQPLFIIDQVPYLSALKTAEANVKSAEASVATAKLTAESKKALFEEKIVSAFDLQMAENTLLEAEAALAQAKAQEINAKNSLSYTVVKSPVSGTTSMIPYRVGALVSSNITTPLVTVSDDEEMYVYFSMNENQILQMSRQNSTVNNMQDVELQLSDGTMYNLKGKIDAISGTIDINTGSVKVRATFPNPDKILRNGASAVVIIPYEMDSVIVIPQEATYEIQDKIFVYKVIDGKTSSSEITVFPINNGKEYIVESGLKKGDIIISEGAGLVKEGELVNVSK